MSEPAVSDRGQRFPAEVLNQDAWFEVRFGLGCRDVEVLPAERAIEVSGETISGR